MVIRLVAHGSADYAGTTQLREEVLRRPLGLPQTASDLMGEEHQLHLAALEDGVVVGCVLLKPLSPSLVKLRQMAVAQTRQGAGLGSALVRAAEAVAAERGFRTVELNARLTAAAFYERLGYHAAGAMFVEVGLPHVKMEKRLG